MVIHKKVLFFICMSLMINMHGSDIQNKKMKSVTFAIESKQIGQIDRQNDIDNEEIFSDSDDEVDFFNNFCSLTTTPTVSPRSVRSSTSSENNLKSNLSIRSLSTLSFQSNVSDTTDENVFTPIEDDDSSQCNSNNLEDPNRPASPVNFRRIVKVDRTKLSRYIRDKNIEAGEVDFQDASTFDGK